MMSNLEISMMLHFASVCQPYGSTSYGSAAYYQALDKLNNLGLIQATTQDEKHWGLPGWDWRATELGLAYVEKLKMVDPREKANV